MKKFVGAWVVSLLLPATSVSDVTQDDLQKLAAPGISDSVVLAYLRSNGPVPKLSAQDLIELKTSGVSDAVLERIASGDPHPKAEPAAGRRLCPVLLGCPVAALEGRPPLGPRGMLLVNRT